MGSLLALVAIGSSVALFVLPVGPGITFTLVGVLLASLAGAALLRTRPGYLATASLLGWLSIMIAAPFSITIQQKRVLERLSRQGDETSSRLLDLYATLEPYIVFVVLAITALVAFIFIIGMRRNREGFFPALLDESNGVGIFVSRIGIASALLFAPMMIIILYDVIQRQYLGYSPGFTNTWLYRVFTSTRIQEMQWHLHAVLFLLCLAYGYVHDAHVRIELVREKMSFRTRAWIELFGCLLFLIPYCYVVINYGIENAQRSFSSLERSASQTGLEYRFIIKSFMPLGFALLALAGLSVALKCIVYLFGPSSLRSASSSHLGTELAHVTSASDA